MEQGAAHRVVAVAGGRRELARRLVGGDEEDIGTLAGDPTDAFAPRDLLRAVANTKRREDFTTGIRGVDMERDARA